MIKFVKNTCGGDVPIEEETQGKQILKSELEDLVHCNF